jgi:cytochrome c oxidase subunit 3
VSQVTAHADDHAHPDFLRHHFDTPKQQFEAGKLGMWLFLATEVLLFGGLFCGYAIWRGNHPELFKYGSQFLQVKWGAINTAVLILSSLTMAAGVTAAQRNQQRLLKIFLTLTLAGAVGFLGIKYVEYKHKFDEGWFPGMRFYEKPGPQSHTWASGHGVETAEAGAGALSANPPSPGPLGVEPSNIAPAAVGPLGLDESALETDEPHEPEHEDEAHTIHPLQDPDRPANAHMFFNIYFMMTGLHGIHVLVGGIMLVWLLIGAMKGRFSSAYFTPVDLGGLYWHVVDLIWIFLFPLFYLI